MNDTALIPFLTSRCAVSAVSVLAMEVCTAGAVVRGVGLTFVCVSLKSEDRGREEGGALVGAGLVRRIMCCIAVWPS
jgi:hypothetical protein